MKEEWKEKCIISPIIHPAARIYNMEIRYVDTVCSITKTLLKAEVIDEDYAMEIMKKFLVKD